MPALGGKTEEDKLRILRTTTSNLSQGIKIILIVRYMRIISTLILAVDASLAGVSLDIRKTEGKRTNLVIRYAVLNMEAIDQDQDYRGKVRL